MNTKQMTDTDAILAMKAELDEERAMLDWLIKHRGSHDLVNQGVSWCVMTTLWLKQITASHDTPRAAIREAMEKSK